tara:strand:+ start:618 stop:947 length:330 start_codon:yes stop_codon:yes gene_type:complete
MKNFIKNMTDIVYPTEKQRIEEKWDVEGRLKKGNQLFKFDIRPVKKENNKLEKVGYFNTKSDKIVFETENEWIIFDTEELHEYIKNCNKTDFLLEDLLNSLSWNLRFNK